jgi:hypothetical protein
MAASNISNFPLAAGAGQSGCCDDSFNVMAGAASAGDIASSLPFSTLCQDRPSGLGEALPACLAVNSHLCRSTIPKHSVYRWRR